MCGGRPRRLQVRLFRALGVEGFRRLILCAVERLIEQKKRAELQEASRLMSS